MTRPCRLPGPCWCPSPHGPWHLSVTRTLIALPPNPNRGSSDMLKPEVLQEKAKLYVESCNTQVHEAPWTTGHTSTPSAGGLYKALELAERAYKAHKLPYEQGLSNMKDYAPRRFTWIYDEGAENFVKVIDTKTGLLANSEWFYSLSE